MTNFNPYTGNKRVGGSKKKGKPTVKKMPYSSKGKGSKLKMSEGGEVKEDKSYWDQGVDAVKDYIGIGAGLRGKQIDKVVEDADKGVNPPKKKKKN
jgi:hypothetical protein